MANPKKQKHTRNKRQFEADVVETKDFAGEVVMGDDGVNKRLKITAKTWYQHQINKFPEGMKVSIYVSNRRPKRSIQQNRYYWGVYLPLIAKETGEQDINGLHNLFSGKFLTTGISEVLGEKVRMKKSTASLSKNDFSEYIMAIEADTGIQAPPTANYFD